MTNPTQTVARFFAWMWNGDHTDDYVDLMLHGAEQFGLTKLSAQDDVDWELTETGQAVLRLAEPE